MPNQAPCTGFSLKAIDLGSAQFSSSVVSDYLRPRGPPAACQASLSITNSWSLLKLMSIDRDK